MRIILHISFLLFSHLMLFGSESETISHIDTTNKSADKIKLKPKVKTETIFNHYKGTGYAILCPNSDKPTPLIIAIHGGSFLYGSYFNMLPLDSNNTERNMITERELEENKIAYASINYTLLKKHKKGVNKSLKDCKKMMEFFYKNAQLYNIDTNNIILLGSSAGATASLWLMLNDYFNTIKGVVCIEPQASLNVLNWQSEVFGPYGIEEYYLQEVIKQDNLIKTLYKSKSPAKINRYSNKHELELLSKINKDDPEILIINNSIDFIHHPCHALSIKRVSDKQGHTTTISRISNLDIINKTLKDNGFEPITISNERIIDFCKRKFKYE